METWTTARGSTQDTRKNHLAAVPVSMQDTIDKLTIFLKMTEIPNDETEDAYKLLRHNNICFKSHVEVLLKKLGFMWITTMSMITDVSVLEKTVLYSHISRVKNACTCLPRMLNLNNENQ
jgi:hypothetical protein